MLDERGWVVLPLVLLFLLAATACGPGARGSIAGEVLRVTDDPAWHLEHFAVSLDGRWLAVSGVRVPELSFRLFLLDLERDRAIEIEATQEAREQLATGGKPGALGMEWAESGRVLRFPAKGAVLRRARPVAVESAWYEVRLHGDRPGPLQLDDTPEAHSRLTHVPPRIDPRIGSIQRSRSAFDLVDRERGERLVGRFRGYFVSARLSRAAVSPDGQWLGITVYRENFGSMGTYSFIVERETGERWHLASQALSELKWHPRRREVFGVAREGKRAPDPLLLMRWRY